MSRPRPRLARQTSNETRASISLGDRLQEYVLKLLLEKSGPVSLARDLAVLIIHFTGRNIGEIVWCRQGDPGTDPEKVSMGPYADHPWRVGIITSIEDIDNDFASAAEAVDMMPRYNVSILGSKLSFVACHNGVRTYNTMKPGEPVPGDTIEYVMKVKSKGMQRKVARWTPAGTPIYKTKQGKPPKRVKATLVKYVGDHRTSTVHTHAIVKVRGQRKKIKIVDICANLSDKIDPLSYLFYRILTDPRVDLLESEVHYARLSILNLQISDLLAPGQRNRSVMNLNQKIEEGAKCWNRKKTRLFAKAMSKNYR